MLLPITYCSLSECYSPGHAAPPGNLWACCSPVYDAAPLPRHNAPPGHDALPGHDAPPGHDAFPLSMLLFCACRSTMGMLLRQTKETSFCHPWLLFRHKGIFSYGRCLGASTKRPLLRTFLPYITVLVCVIPCIICS